MSFPSNELKEIVRILRGKWWAELPALVASVMVVVNWARVTIPDIFTPPQAMGALEGATYVTAAAPITDEASAADCCEKLIEMGNVATPVGVEIDWSSLKPLLKAFLKYILPLLVR